MPAGFAYLVRRPRLWPTAVLPALLVAAFLLLGFILGVFAARWVGTTLAPGPERVPPWLSDAITVLLWLATLLAGMVVGLAVALLLSAPALDRLSRQVEHLQRGEGLETPGRLGWELKQSLRGSVYFLAAAPAVFLLGLVPVAGPALGALWGAHALSFQETDGVLARRGLDFRGRREWHRRWRAESLGFGLAGLIPFLLPLANFLLAPLFAPALTVGATLLVLELEEGKERVPATLNGTTS